MSSSRTRLVTLQVDLAAEDVDEAGNVRLPKQNLDEGEHITRRLVRLDALMGVLEGKLSSFGAFTRRLTVVEYEQKGFIVETRLHTFAVGWALASEL